MRLRYGISLRLSFNLLRLFTFFKRIILVRYFASDRVGLMLRVAVNQLFNRIEDPEKALLGPAFDVCLIVLLLQLRLRFLEEIAKISLLLKIFIRVVGLSDGFCIFIE